MSAIYAQVLSYLIKWMPKGVISNNLLSLIIECFAFLHMSTCNKHRAKIKSKNKIDLTTKLKA